MRTRKLAPVSELLDASGLGAVRIRAIRAADASELQSFYGRLSPESLRSRFLFVSTGLNQAQATSYCATDHDHREGFVAVVQDADDRESIVGHLCLEPDGADAEVAIVVADDFQHRGIGRLLMGAGTAWANREHIARLTATAFATNAQIHRLLAGLGLPARMRYAGAGMSEITIDLAAGHSLAA